MSKDNSPDIKPFLIFGLQLHHHSSSIKIGTDAVLLSASIRRYSAAHRILDIGCGCGIIGLSFLNKHSESNLIGLDIHMPSITQAICNAHLNNLSHRAVFHCHDFLNYTSDLFFDLVVSNPPFFLNQLHSPNDVRNNARHGDNNLSIYRLIEKAGLINTKELVMIIPEQIKCMVLDKAESCQFYLTREITIFSKPDSRPPIRAILFFTREEATEPPENLKLTIRNSNNSFNAQYLDYVYDS